MQLLGVFITFYYLFVWIVLLSNGSFKLFMILFMTLNVGSQALINPMLTGARSLLTLLLLGFTQLFLSMRYEWDKKIATWYHNLFERHADLKPNSPLPEKNSFSCFNESPLQVMKNNMYFILKAFFILKSFIFLSWPFRSCGKTVCRES